MTHHKLSRLSLWNKFGAKRVKAISPFFLELIKEIKKKTFGIKSLFTCSGFWFLELYKNTDFRIKRNTVALVKIRISCFGKIKFIKKNYTK